MAAQALFWGAIGLYGAACALYFAFILGSPRSAPAARWAMVVAFLAHMSEIGARGVAGVHPATSAREALGFVAWLLVGGFLLAQIRRPLDAVGAFVAPAAVVMLLMARLTPGGGSTESLGMLGRIHISLATAGVSIFALATAVAVLYLIEERQLKRKHIGALVRRGTALETLDKLAHRCVQVGFPVFTVAMITGAMWSAQLPGTLRPEYTVAAIAWAAFAGLLVARTTAGWRGRRAALVTIFGFSSALLVLGVYLVRAAQGG